MKTARQRLFLCQIAHLTDRLTRRQDTRELLVFFSRKSEKTERENPQRPNSDAFYVTTAVNRPGNALSVHLGFERVRRVLFGLKVKV